MLLDTLLHHQIPHGQLDRIFQQAFRPTVLGLHHHGQLPIQEIRIQQPIHRECHQWETWQSVLRGHRTCPLFHHRRITTAHQSHQTLTRQHHPQDSTQ